MTVELADGCFVVTVPGESRRSTRCELQDDDAELELDDVFEDPEAVEDL